MSFVALVAAPALGHATLVRVTPANGTTVDEAPQRVSLVFDENVRLTSTVVVSGPSGRVDDGEPEVVDNELSVGVTITARPADVGTYRVAYRAMSVDGHPLAGEARFRYAPPGVEPTSGTTQDDSTTEGARSWWIAAGLALVAALALVLLLPRRSRGRSR